jgi:PhnB protein
MTRIAPLLSVRRGAEAVAFYERAFAARTLHRIEDGKGEVVAQLRVGDAEFWVSDESPEHGNFSPETVGGATARMILAVDDPVAVFDGAIAAGAREVHPVAARHGWLLGRVVDPYGHHWEIGRPPKDAG